MNFSDYQIWTRTTAIYPKDKGLDYAVVGIGNEAGEALGVLKKSWRDGEKPDFREKLASEIVDVVWYCARALDELGIDFSEAVANNVRKLESRKDRGVLGGSGDNR